MNRKLTVLTVALAVGISASAQESPKDAGIHDLITVDHHKVCVDITDFQGGTISGHADLMVRSKAAKTRSISLNLLSMEVDEVSYRGKVLPEGSYSYDGSVLSIDLPRPLKTRKATPVGVSYHGTPQGRSFGGFTWFPQMKMAHNMGVSIDDIPHSYAKSWYPAVDDFRAKSTYEMTYRVPDGFTAVGNGLLQDYTDLPDETCLWTWKISDNVPDYLINVAVAEYRHIHMDYSSISNRTVPIDIYVTPDEYDDAVKAYSIVPSVLRSLEKHFGPYAFERVGYVSVNTTGGAMEHATNISMPRSPQPTASYRELAIHELIHSWFGNLVTCERPGDMWLNEGITSYVVETVIEELIKEGSFTQEDLDAYQREVDFLATYIKKGDRRYHPIADTPETDTYGNIVYKKGAWVTRKLRQLLGDEAFFGGLRNYVREFAFDNATTEEFKASMERSTGTDLSDFFNEYIYN